MKLDLERFPRRRLAHLPTPLEPMPRLSSHLSGPQLWVKRDDCTGLATGGNKARKLEFLVADALASKADLLLTQGAVQSNHVRQTAAAAAHLGLKCHVILEERLAAAPEEYHRSGNVFLDGLFGATVERRPGGTDMDAALAEVAERITAEGRRPYVIPGGGSNAVGALGYAACALELLEQARAQNIRIDHIVHATGSAGTQAGLLAGLAAAGAEIPVHGISVRFDKARQEERVHALASATADRLGARAVSRDAVVAYDAYVGSGYGHPTKAMVEAVRLAAELEGLLFDPVYSGKAMAGLLDLVARGIFRSGETVVFVHTGGQASLFAYQWAFGTE
jgi:L-cysteate sulfo-lyase